MTKQTIIVKVDTGISLVTEAIGQILLQGKACTVDIEEGERKKRSKPANAVYAVWIGEIAQWQGTPEKDVRNELKRDIGIHILLAADDETAKVINYTLDKIDYWLMSHEQQAKVMNTMSVTSIMSTKQHNLLRERVQQYYSEQGLILEVK